MINRSLLFLLALGGLLMGLAWPAFAQGSTEQTAADACAADDHCSKLADQGYAQHQQGRYEAALANFREAYALYPDPALLFNIGRSYQSLGKMNEALAAYRAFRQQSQTKGEALALEREKARVAIEQIERERAAQATVPSQAASSPPEKKPIHKKWWFWTILGGAAAAVVVGTAIGVSAREPDLPGIMQYRLFPGSQ